MFGRTVEPHLGPPRVVPTTRGRSRLGAAVARLAVLAVALAPGLLTAQPRGAEPAAVVLGRVCEDVDGDGRCGPDEPGLAGVEVRTARGARVITDDLGRYHLARVWGRSRARLESGASLTRLFQESLRVDARGLGPAARPSPPVWVDLLPGGVHRVDLAVRIDRPREAAPVRAGAATGEPPDFRLTADGVIVAVPVVLPEGHRLRAVAASSDEGGDDPTHLEVPLTGREAVVDFIDEAPDGRRRVLRQRVLRVPRAEGGDLVIVRPAELLARVDLPPAGSAVAPGALEVRVQAPPGTVLASAGQGETRVGESGEGRLVVPVHLDGDTELELKPPAGAAVRIPMPLEVRPGLARRVDAAAQVRGGLAGRGAFGEAHVDGLVDLPLFGGSLLAGVRLSDETVTAALDDGALLRVDAGAIYERVPDPEREGIAFGDDSQTVEVNPAGLTLFADWRGDAGRVGLGGARTPLSSGEVGRLDRAVLGPHLVLAEELGPVRLEAAGAADAWATGLAQAPPVAPGRVELAGTGGAFYRLPHREVAEGSERIFLERLDPRTGLVTDRRLLVRGRDYDIDYPSGRILLDRPLGLGGAPVYGRLSERGLGATERLAVDYQFRVPPGGVPHASSAARVAAAAGPVELGLRAGGMNAGRHRLVGVDLAVTPAEWLAVEGSVARTEGDAFADAAEWAASRDGGLTFARPATAGSGGDAWALRARVGSERSGLTVWGNGLEAGFSDGAMPAGAASRHLGSLGRLDLGRLRLFAGADHRRVGDTDALDAGARAEVDLWKLTLAAEASHASHRVAAGVSGDASAVGLEVAWQAHEALRLSVGHLQGVAVSGEGPAAVDPTLTSVGAQLRVADRGELEGRVGMDASGRPVVRAGWSERGEGVERYGAFAVGTDAPWDGQPSRAVAGDSQATRSVSGGRQLVSPQVSAFAESQLVTTTLGEHAGVTAVGGTTRRGPLALTASYERAVRAGDPSGALRDGLHGRAGWAAGPLSASVFGEYFRAPGVDEAAPFGRGWASGALAAVRLHPEVHLAGRVLLWRGLGPVIPVERPSLEASATASWRPRALRAPAVLAHYGVAGDGRPDLAGLWHRRHLARLAADGAALGGLRLGGVVALGVDEARGLPSEERAAVRVAVASLRLAWPVRWLEPALEVGGRRVWGAGLEAELEGTVRMEALFRQGALGAGAGLVLVGYRGTGLEPATGAPVSPRVYLVVRGAM